MLYEMPRGKSIEIEGRLEVVRGWGKEDRGVTAEGYGVSPEGNENVLELDTGNICTTLGTCEIPLSCAL